VVGGLDSNAFTTEVVGCVVSEAFVEHREDVGSDVVDADAGVLDEGRIELAEIVVAEIEELGRELDASGW
jgi:hypothetical protein